MFKMFAAATLSVLSVLAVILPPTGEQSQAVGAETWTDASSIRLKGCKVSLSAPNLVARRSSGHLWFPALIPLANGELMAAMQTCGDVEDTTMEATWSGDGGLTWSKLSGPGPLKNGNSHITLPSGDELFLPFKQSRLIPGLPEPTGGLGYKAQLVPKGKREIRAVEKEVTVLGWPRIPYRFYFFGQGVRLKDGGYVMPMYGTFTSKVNTVPDVERTALVAAQSRDGMAWTIRSIIADEKCTLPGKDGPCEGALCRLKDGRWMCVFRLQSREDYGQTWSSDEGKTWTEPVPIKNVRSVAPSLAVMKNGVIVLSGGRKDLDLWVNVDGTGKDWQHIDMLAHHNKYVPKEPIVTTNTGDTTQTTSYTTVLALDDTHLLLIYDRMPRAWSLPNPPPATGPNSDSNWAVRVTIEKP